MNVVHGIEAFQEREETVSLALGTFDGLHRGHRAVIETLRASRSSGDHTVATTFDPHPLAVIAPPPEPFLLTTLEERIELFRRTGIDTLVVVRFDQALRTRSAEDWLTAIHRHVGPSRIVVSSTHTFGHHREGNTALLEAWAAARGITVVNVPPVSEAGAVITSTAVRRRLREGDVRSASIWLGRWYAVTGRVVPGAGRGRQIGVPTANLRIPAEKLIPAQGVYAAYATAEHTTYPAAVNIGVRPTFGGTGAVTVETHLIDADVDLDGTTLEVGFVERLRSEQRFADAAALREQIGADLTAVRRMLKHTQHEPV